MAEKPETEETERVETNLAEFVPVAVGVAEFQLEEEVAVAWRQQIKEIEKRGKPTKEDASGESDASDSSSRSSRSFTVIKPMRAARRKKYEDRSYARFWIGKNELTKVRVPIIPMCPSRADIVPMMTHWTKVDSNLRVKLRQGNNQLGVDAFCDEDDDEIRKIMELTRQSTPIADKSSIVNVSTLKNDQIFINCVKSMLEVEQKQCQQPVGDAKSNVFHAISEACPGIGFPYELRDRYAWLTRHKTGSEPSKCAIIPRNEVLKSSHELFCRRCFVYNCLLHGPDERVDVRSTATLPALDEESEACGRSCYKLLWGAVEENCEPEPESPQEIPKLNKKKEQDRDLQVSGYISMESSDVSSDDDMITMEDDSSGSDSIIVVGSFFPDTNKNNSVNDLNFANESHVANKELSGTKGTGDQRRLITGNTVDTANKPDEDDSVHNLFEDQNPVDEAIVSVPEILKEWSDDELSIYSAIRIIYQNNFCQMARVIDSKTCLEVYKLSREKKLHSNEDCDNISRKRRSPKKRKKSSQDKIGKTWFNHCKQYNLILARKHKDKPTSQPIYTPCNHPNRLCDLSICCCLQKHIPCEKFCSCFYHEEECENLYPGCHCQGACNSNTCQCHIANRECDVDLCSCGLEKLVTLNIKDVTCKNISIQMRQGNLIPIYVNPQHYGAKKVQRNISTVAGWGLFASEPIKKFEFIGEYVGEIISTAESERRGEHYDRMKYTFLFTKDEENCIDGMLFGSSMRFINSSPNPNCYPLIKSVYGNLRIGLYANKNIAEGEELLFDYMKVIKQQEKNAESTTGGIKIPKKTVPASVFQPGDETNSITECVSGKLDSNSGQ